MLLFGFSPLSALAACGAQGESVAYVNGILTNTKDAKNELFMLRLTMLSRPESRDITFINVFNPSHLAGLGDLAESVSQVLGTPISDFDYTNMTQQLHEYLSTRKVLLLGYSQGSLYTNSLYAYLLSHGEPKEAVGVYNVATPASTVAGGGAYLNSKEDIALSMIAAAAKKVGAPPPLPGNIDIIISPEDIAHNPVEGHSFVDAYLMGAPGKVGSDTLKNLSTLKPVFASETGDCFDAPPESVGERFERGVFRVADPIAGIAAGVFSRVAKVCI